MLTYILVLFYIDLRFACFKNFSSINTEKCKDFEARFCCPIEMPKLSDVLSLRRQRNIPNNITVSATTPKPRNICIFIIKIFWNNFWKLKDFKKIHWDLKHFDKLEMISSLKFWFWRVKIKLAEVITMLVIQVQLV